MPIPVLHKLWLLFAQAATLCLAALFVVATLRPDLIGRPAEPNGQVVLLQETSTPVASRKITSFADAVQKASPAVVNVFTSKEMRQRHPLVDDELLRRYFPDLAQRLPPQRATSLGSGVIVSPDGYVLTSNHVIEGADEIQLVLRRRPPPAGARSRHRSGVRSRRAEGRRDGPASDRVREP